MLRTGPGVPRMSKVFNCGIECYGTVVDSLLEACVLVNHIPKAHHAPFNILPTLINLHHRRLSPTSRDHACRPPPEPPIPALPPLRRALPRPPIIRSHPTEPLLRNRPPALLPSQHLPEHGLFTPAPLPRGRVQSAVQLDHGHLLHHRRHCGSCRSHHGGDVEDKCRRHESTGDCQDVCGSWAAQGGMVDSRDA